MLEKEFTIRNKSGLHVRPASVLAGALGKFESNVTINFNGGDYNAKSVINVLAAAIKTGDTIMVKTEGSDEEVVMNVVTELIEAGLGEGIM